MKTADGLLSRISKEFLNGPEKLFVKRISSGLIPRSFPHALSMRLHELALLILTIAIPIHAADRSSARRLSELSTSQPHNLVSAIRATFEKKELVQGTAWANSGLETFFAIENSVQPQLLIDNAPGPVMNTIQGSGLYYASAQVGPLGTLHSFYYAVNGKKVGGSEDLGILGPLAELQPGVAAGKLSTRQSLISKVYEGMKIEYWVYVPFQYDPSIPAAIMVFQDGEGYTRREGNSPILNMIDNLIAEKQIPVLICVFVNPGDIKDVPKSSTYNFIQAYSEKWHRSIDDSTRSLMYDTVSDRYPRFLRDEILAEVEKGYNIRKDAYSRAITGLSSGGICAFNAAWQMPDQFSRVITWIGSFTSIQWHEDSTTADGGQDYPEKVLREKHRNLRVWMQDGGNDLEWNQYGSWPVANIRMANALKLKEYDFHFSFGKGSHNSAHGVVEFPREMVWLWRDYNSALTDQTYELEPGERAKPMFRVTVTNRDSD